MFRGLGFRVQGLGFRVFFCCFLLGFIVQLTVASCFFFCKGPMM